MLTSLGSFLQVASGLLVLAALTGVGMMRARVTNLADRVNDLRGEVADKDRQLAELHGLRVKDKAERVRQGHDIDALRRVVTGEAHWISIGRKLDEHHTAAMTHFAADEELLGRILQAMNVEGGPT